VAVHSIVHVWLPALATLLSTTLLAAAPHVRAPLLCSRGPSGQHFDVLLTLPRTAPEASIYSVRIDGVDSGKISHTGLNYIHDMSTDYLLPSGATYVPGSARIVPNTGTANVAAGAYVRHEAGMIRVVLPGHVDSGSSYTPPSVELRLKVAAPAGTALALKLLEYRVTANAFLVGDVLTTCEPSPKPYTLGATLVTAASPKL
jgi:hypothetical protein